ncbi:hypothetical protein DYB28_013007 [Aphanomyces astaci]|uniref:Uncharacterized protein n=1 Tax=Aphanomyces astaci TaxID=112090 RepID=A0A397ANX8_APHAT|nr:hypothetical protein AaE_007858 [Aphanomyces astaci]RHY07975.1 hypothetical protein DYB36_001532 [Aphanomyces astaci]RLO03322.1 hypothetical protein DYB28_013007 [Aphanomyces astaci]
MESSATDASVDASGSVVAAIVVTARQLLLSHLKALNIFNTEVADLVEEAYVSMESGVELPLAFVQHRIDIHTRHLYLIQQLDVALQGHLGADNKFQDEVANILPALKERLDGISFILRLLIQNQPS